MWVTCICFTEEQWLLLLSSCFPAWHAAVHWRSVLMQLVHAEPGTVFDRSALVVDCDTQQSVTWLM